MVAIALRRSGDDQITGNFANNFINATSGGADTISASVVDSNAAAGNQVSTSKGGPYAVRYPASAGVEVRQYGYFVVTDNGGSTVSITFHPRKSNGSNVFAAKTHEFTNVPL